MLSPRIRRFSQKRRSLIAHPTISRPVATLLAFALLFILVPPFVPTAPPPTLVSLPEEHAPNICRRNPQPPLYVFLHLHKTAGNALKSALFVFAKRNSLALHHTCHPAEPDSPLLAWYLARHKSPNSLDCNLRPLSRLAATKRNALSLIIGHQHFGAHNLFPTRSVRYFTFLRHPLRRKISHFRHFEQRNTSLPEYLVVSNRNYMSKRLSTTAEPSDLTARLRARFLDFNPFAARAAAAAAREHLVAHFFFVGLYERHAQSVCLLSKLLNAACGPDGKALAKERRFRAKLIPPRPRPDDETERLLRNLAPDIRRAAETAEAADMEVYRFAQALFERKLALYPECADVA